MYKLLVLVGALASAYGFLLSSKASNCTDNDFFCQNFECVPSKMQCDGNPDCSDGSDEHDCDMFHCASPDFFRCKNSRCISSAFVCDLENDCDDFSDEENCEEFKKKLEKNSTCTRDQWQCTDKLCIPLEWVCNGEPDCLDGSDEALGCSHTMECNDGFKCKNGHCIFKEWRCDGQDDCRDNSDEEDCESHFELKECTLENQRFLCSDTKTCIKLSEVCDEVNHCPDKSDEGFSCKKTCENCSHNCVQLPTGPKCLCPKGYRNIDEKHCQDINECEIYGICDQKCKNTPGSFECYCEDNYNLQEDKKSCKAHFGEALMFFSSKDQIRAYLLRSELYFPVAKNLNQVVGVDFDGLYVYWTDILSEHESIVRSLKDGEQKELLVTAGLGAPEDLHVDYITRNIYFTDAERQHIGVCTNDGSYCTVLVTKDVQKPRAIVLNSLEGEMYWTDWGHKPHIARALMDGTNGSSFISSDIHWPNGLTIDYPNSRLYWTDAKLMTLESIRLDGTDRRIVLNEIVKHPYAIAVFENRLYWSDWSTHSIQSCDKFTGKNHHTIIKEQKEYIYGITIYHPNNHKTPHLNPCVHKPCSDICLLSGPQGFTCACPQNKELSSNGFTCRDLEKKQKLVLGAGNLLIEVEHQVLGRHEVNAMPITVKKMGALTYSSVENVIYVSDLELRKIISVNLHTEMAKPIDVGSLGHVTAMDYDYLGNNLYWCDSLRDTIEVYNFNTNSRKILLHDTNGETPESIALVPEEGIMFVAFRRFGQRDGHVDRFLMDGTSRTHPIENGLLGPISLYYDSDIHRILIADSGTRNIESTSVEGDDRHGFRSLQTNPIGITSLKSEVFWVNRNSKELYWADKYNSGDDDYNKKITLDLPDDIDRMYLVSVTPRKIGLSPCQRSNGGCSHLCLQSHKTIVCACPVDMSLDSTNKTCIKRIDCTSHEFFCSGSNSCIFKKFRCDGERNCPNGEDETDCKELNHCPWNNFQCHDGECIDERFKCDYKFDCRDKSDERNCSIDAKKCPPGHFMCKSGQCINERLVCDGVKDCLEEEDEANCVSTVCKDYEFRCQSGACIPKNWECDHDYDCPDFSDEHSGCASCDASTFTCNNGKCIDKSFVCDKENDCSDNSDELSCVMENSCDLSEFSCSLHTHICLPDSARCNGTSECPHHEDEQNCSNCQVDEFSCNNTKCIPREWICDHSDDCGDGSDEVPSLCNHTIPEHATNFSCIDRFRCRNGNCIDFSLVCNKEPNCYDGSDEEGLCNTSCSALNNPCSQICVKTPTGPTCKCQGGYQLRGDGHTCEDINECAEHPPVCSQICHNSEGSYSCDCYEGFALRTDRTSCKAKGTAMSLIFSSNNQIREISQLENSLKMLYSEETPRITSLDVGLTSGAIYFTVENSNAILKINKGDTKREYLENVGQPCKITLDWRTNNIYYFNNAPTTKSIGLCNFNDKTCANLIPVDTHRQVSALVVDPINNVLFYSLVSWWIFNSPSYIVYKTNLDGTGGQELIKTSPGYITGLSYDLYKKELYFISQHQLSKIKYDGSDRTVLLSNLTQSVGLNFFENHLYFKSGNFMQKCRLYSPITCETFGLKGDVFAIAQESRQPEFGNNPCQNHTCNQLCIPAKPQYRCLCENGKFVEPEEDCDTLMREANDDGRRVKALHYVNNYASSNLGPVIAGVMISICLVTFGAVLYYLIKRRNSGTFNVISMKFHNPGYGLHTDEFDRSILKPGQHEYENPVEFYGSENDNHTNIQVNV
ncbi:vitellogenin receptor isoform X1 [Tribolium castaneum]|uniref:Vitellogenin receptor-like Protein n=1 Tax=Tribolium castaneum TaxID=7070 RepID=A0A139WE08_TRICA|nr:PREDICTED: vitellogenin receptor [Tribolium castaneum]KYB26208.1 Putative vitellogenin receptor-like Protein [Tribolium castaneum]|eukprot:XP_015837722.1 PREDICTED: vitellogenin receptor [Tribolium castaneum]